MEKTRTFVRSSAITYHRKREKGSVGDWRFKIGKLDACFYKNAVAPRGGYGSTLPEEKIFT